MSSVDDLWQDYCTRNGPIAHGMTYIEEPDGTITWTAGTLIEHDVLRACVKHATRIPLVACADLDLDQTHWRVTHFMPLELYNRRDETVKHLVATMAEAATRRDVTKLAIERIRVERIADPDPRRSTVRIKISAWMNHTPQWMNAHLIRRLAEECDDAASGITLRRFNGVDATVAPDEMVVVEERSDQWTMGYPREELLVQTLCYGVAAELDLPRPPLRGYAIMSVTRVAYRDRPSVCEKIVAHLALYHAKPPP